MTIRALIRTLKKVRTVVKQLLWPGQKFSPEVSEIYIETPSRQLYLGFIVITMVISMLLLAYYLLIWGSCGSDFECQQCFIIVIFTGIASLGCIFLLWIKYKHTKYFARLVPVLIPIFMVGILVLYYYRMIKNVVDNPPYDEMSMRLFASVSLGVNCIVFSSILVTHHFLPKFIVVVSGLTILSLTTYPNVGTAVIHCGFLLEMIAFSNWRLSTFYETLKKISNMLDEKSNTLKLFDQLQVGILVINNKKEISYVNSFVSRLFQYNHAIKNVQKFLDDNDDVKINEMEDNNNAKNKPIFESPGLLTFKYVVDTACEISSSARLEESKNSQIPPVQKYELQLTKSGVSYYVELNIQKMVQDGAENTILLFQDVTQTHENVTLKQNNAYKNALLASVSHELKTPLNHFIGFLNSSLDLISNPVKEQYIQPSISAAKLMNFLMDDIIDFVGVSIDTVTQTKLKPIDIVELMGDTYVLFEHLAKVKGIWFTFSLDADIKTNNLQVDPRIGRILIHLINNALKFTFAGSVSFKAAMATSNKISFIVHDTGTGMLNSQKLELERVLKAPKSHHLLSPIRNSKGVCLGLSMAQNLAKKLGSKGITIERTEVGQGSTFQFTVPLHSSDEVIQVTSELPGYKTANSEFIGIDIVGSGTHSTKKILCSCKRVLVVDDNDYNIFTLKSMLQKRGMEVVSASNGKHALEQIEQLFKPVNRCSEKCDVLSLIFMDIDMPVMNGLECTKNLKLLMNGNSLPRIPIIGCSAFTSDKDIHEAINSGMDAYLTKPVYDNKLEEAMKGIR